MARLTESEIQTALSNLTRWERQDQAITRTFSFTDFPEAIRFVDQLAVAAESAWHHPDIDIRWNKVRLLLTTHDEKGLTTKDFDLAHTFDNLAETNTPPSEPAD